MQYRTVTLQELHDCVDPATYRKYVAVLHNFLDANPQLAQREFLSRLLVTVPVTKKPFDESEHPREPAGSPTGGQFTSGGGGGGSGSTAPVSNAKPSAPDKPTKKKIESTREFANQGITLDSAIRLDGSEAGKKFIERWNEAVGEAPADFKNKFMGGLPGTMGIRYTEHNDELSIIGDIHDDSGHSIGEYHRQIDLDDKSAYSAYFKMKSAERGAGAGKKLLAGNVEMYQQLGLEKLKVSANIDVGGYAWARFGYVPTAAGWGELSRTIRNRIDNLSGGGGRQPSGDTYTPDSWDEIGESDRDRIFNAWANDSRQEFIDSDIENWRDGGGDMEQAKQNLASDFSPSDDWIVSAIQEWRANRVESGKADPPYTDEQIANAITIEYSSRYDDGRDDPDIGFDDAFLKEPIGYDPAQQTLPGIEPLAPEEFFTEEMRDELSKDLINDFNNKAERDASDIDPPDYISENVNESQQDYWDQMDDDSRYNWARDNNELPEIEIEPDEDDEDQPAADEDAPEPEESELDTLRQLTMKSDPKALWVIADSKYGKQLLLNTAWPGVINFKDKEQMDRFHAYVSKGK